VDPISQGVVGAAFAQSTLSPAQRDKIVTISWLGCAAGMAPDLDVFIRSASDPLLFLEFHRHFTHALIFIPFGALVVAATLYYFARQRLSWRETYLVCFIGYATHGLLDACTTYGTQLFWPFSNMRVAWNNISVVDPVFTIPLLVLVVLAARKRRKAYAYAAIGWALFYLSLGAVQMLRATEVARLAAELRGHTPQRLTLKPSFANLILWKSIYEHDQHYYVDAVRITTSGSWCVGQRVEKLDLKRHLPFLAQGDQQAKDLARFRWFSHDYLTPLQQTNATSQRVTDIRYSMIPNEVDPMWGITLAHNASKNTHVTWWTQRDADREKRSRFASLIAGHGCKPLNP